MRSPPCSYDFPFLLLATLNLCGYISFNIIYIDVPLVL
jgi:hypothetical protein